MKYVHGKEHKDISSMRHQREERGRESPALALLAGAQIDIWLEREELGTSLLLCPGQMFSKKTKIFFPCSTLFTNVFEALNLLLIIL
jgi:hypothetical protein